MHNCCPFHLSSTGDLLALHVNLLDFNRGYTLTILLQVLDIKLVRVDLNIDAVLVDLFVLLVHRVAALRLVNHSRRVKQDH